MLSLLSTLKTSRNKIWDEIQSWVCFHSAMKTTRKGDALFICRIYIGSEWGFYVGFYCKLFRRVKIEICDAIKQNESELENINLKIQPNKEYNFFVSYCFYNHSKCYSSRANYPISTGFSPKLKLKWYSNRKCRKKKTKQNKII